MIPHNMKQMALSAALADSDGSGSYSVDNAIGLSRLTCACHDRVDFIFSLHQRDNVSQDFRYTLSSLTEKEASVWLYGAGLQ